MTSLIHVVDVGANPIDDTPSYCQMLKDGLCHVTGFEPQLSALAKLNSEKGLLETYYPYALGDGLKHTLNICAYSGWTSLFTPSQQALEFFSFYKSNATIIDQQLVQTHRLDDLDEVDEIDFLRMDIQGSELMVLQHGREKLKNAVVIELEIPFVSLYTGQPVLGEIDLELRSQGFVPHHFASLKKYQDQYLEANWVYIRDMTQPDNLSEEQLQNLGLIMTHCYRSTDFTQRCTGLMAKRLQEVSA